MDERDEKHKGFNLFTMNRVYHLRADSNASARQWVKQLQKVIFKSRNQGNNVKVIILFEAVVNIQISIPIANVLEVEEVHLLGSSDTLKMTVVDNDETFAMSEFYFSFFSRTREAFTKLQAALNAKSDDETTLKSGRRVVSSESTKFQDSVKDTTTFIRASSPTAETYESGGSSRHSLEKVGSSRHSLEISRHSLEGRRSTERGRASLETTGDIMDDAELIEAGPKSPKPKRSFTPRAILGHFSYPSRTRSPSPSPLRQTSFDFERISHSRSSGATSPIVTEEPSWTDTGKMLWSRGVNVAHWMRQRSAEVGTQVGTMLASPSSTINAGVGKVSQFWNGDGAHGEHARYISEETAKDMKDQNPEERFQTHFALPPSEKLLGSYYGYVFRTFPFYGKMYVSKRYFCFRSLLPGIKTKVLLKVLSFKLIIDGSSHQRH